MNTVINISVVIIIIIKFFDGLIFTLQTCMRFFSHLKCENVQSIKAWKSYCHSVLYKRSVELQSALLYWGREVEIINSSNTVSGLEYDDYCT